jgi:hypothetical protein
MRPNDWELAMNGTNQSEVLRRDLLRRLNVIEARLEAANRRTQGLLREASADLPEDDPARRLEGIESKLTELEERLKRIEAEMRDKESPPESFGTSNQFSTGQHFPGLG